MSRFAWSASQVPRPSGHSHQTPCYLRCGSCRCRCRAMQVLAADTGLCGTQFAQCGNSGAMFNSFVQMCIERLSHMQLLRCSHGRPSDPTPAPDHLLPIQISMPVEAVPKGEIRQLCLAATQGTRTLCCIAFISIATTRAHNYNARRSETRFCPWNAR